MSDTAFAESVNHGMSTVMTHKVFGKYAEESLKAVRNEAVRLEGLMSRFIPGSEISRVNESAGISYESLSHETFEVLSCAVEFSGYCQGLFDVTIGPLISLWQKGKEAGNPPEESSIKDIIPLVGYKGLLLDPCNVAAKLERPGQSIDLGGIGKGFTGDKFLEIFREYGVSSAFTNIGGNVVALGTKPDGSPWRVGIQHPRQADGLIGLVEITDKAVVTSGDYRRFFMGGNGKTYHHILDPTTGYPAESGLASVTVVAGNSMKADALSTMMFIAGMEKGLRLLDGFEGAEAILVEKNLRVHITGGLAGKFQAVEGIAVNVLKMREEAVCDETKGKVGNDYSCTGNYDCGRAWRSGSFNLGGTKRR